MRLSNHRVLCGTFLFLKTHKFGKLIVRQNSLSKFFFLWHPMQLLQHLDVNLPDFHCEPSHFQLVERVLFAFWWTTNLVPLLR